MNAADKMIRLHRWGTVEDLLSRFGNKRSGGLSPYSGSSDIVPGFRKTTTESASDNARVPTTV